MGRLDHHCYTFRIEMTPDAIGDFRRQPLLNLQPPGKGVEHTRQLRYPNHMVARQISNMGHADDRCHVVFAMRLEGDVLQKDNFIIAAHLLECPAEMMSGFFAISLAIFFPGTSDTDRKSTRLNSST